MNAPFVMSDEVQAARAAGAPVVALESTIITHGLPAPRNIQTAMAAEAEVRAAGAAPATIAVLGGELRVGLSEEELRDLAAAREVMKLSRADLAAAMVVGADGATTVAATMIAAHLAGIEVFATGGIGGVHRGAEKTFDISADLDELAATPVTVVAAGAKAILDLPKTLEALETRGVPVIGYRTNELPAFWSRTSGLPVPLRMDEPGTIARAHRLRRRLGLAGGQLVANPPPANDELPGDIVAPIVEAALLEAERSNVTGKALTPFLLAKVLDATKGRSLEANVALYLNNCRLAARVAVALANCED